MPAAAVLLLLPLFFAAPSAAAPARAAAYTVHLGSFDDLISAGDLFNRAFRQVPDEDKDLLRIEFTKNRFSVRAGRFTAEDDAKKARRAFRRLAPNATVMRMKPDEQPEMVLIEHSSGVSRLASSRDTAPQHPPASVQDDPAVQAASEQEAIGAVLEKIAGYYQNAEYDQADVLIRKALKKWPDRHELYAWHAATLLDTGNADKAYEQYRKASELRPTAPEYHAGAGFSLLNISIDRAKRSIDAFEQALALDPNNANALEGLGIVYVSIGKQQLAQDMYARLKQVDAAAAERLRAYLAWGVDWSR
ncbi:MAG: hypothetical protein OHK006_23160 [Thermodesulfovibrionales bacterium]